MSHRARKAGGNDGVTIYNAGVSSPGIRRFVLASLQNEQPKVVLDLGCGVGAYGTMIRKELFPQPRLIGVDAWLPYLEMDPCRCYDELIWADLFDVVRGKLDLCFDCVLCMDVIEHLDKKDGKVLSDWLLQQPLAYLSTPLFPFRQIAVDGNRYECHLSYYDLPELAGMGWKPIAKVAWDETRWMGAFKNA